MALAPDVIVTTGGQSMELMVKATRTVPIVVAIVPDPVGSGLVARLLRPGGNATGFMRFAYSLSGKWLELLKQMAPGMTRAAVLRDPIVTAGIGQFAVIQAVAPSVGVEVSPIDTSNAAEIERAVSDFARESSCRTNREATGEIGQQITGIQAATLESVTAIKEISGTIERLSEISSTIAAAVEEQGGATQEISRNVQQAALGTQEVSSHITDVQRGASETGSASSEVLSAAQSLSSDSKRLKLEVGKFLNTVRAA